MTGEVVAAVLAAALFHAGWNALVRIAGDRLAVMGLIAAGHAACALAALPFVAMPDSAALPWLAASVTLHVGYKLFLAEAYRGGELGQVYPVARGTAPLLVTGISLLWLDEPLAPATLAGVAVIALGVASLALRGGAPLGDNPRPMLFALGTAGFIAAYTLVDGLGARIAGTPHGYAAWLFLGDGVLTVAIVLAVRRRAALALMRDQALPGLCGGALSVAAYWLVIWAMTRAPIAPVAALRETSVIFAALIGGLFLGEGFGPRRLIAALAVCLGLALMRL
jgi:drug/metabolite transporter (DMT)-like permease